MRKYLDIKSVALLLAVLMLLAFTGCSSSGKAVVANSDFEQGMTASGGISGWQRYD